MLDKTKATMPGRQCSTENREQDQHTRPVAGGQSLSAPEITRTAPLARFTPVLAFTTRRGTALQHTQSPEFSGDAILKIVGCILITRQYFPQWGECEPVAHTLFLRTSLGCVQILLLCSPVLGRSNIECRGQRNFAPAVFTHDFVDLTYTKNVGQTPDLAFAQPFGSIPRLRNSALPNSFSQLLVLVFSACASSSNCLRNSAGMRIGSIGDLPPPLGCLSRDIDMYMPIGLWLTQIGIYTNMCESTKTTPRSAGTLPRRLTKPLIGVTVMADKQHTQTHPKFTWLFLATPKSYPDCSPVVLRFDTDTEENARAAFPGWEMVFAAKIRAEAPCRVAFFDYNTRRGWAFDSASDREVVGHD
ncbi:host cell division inhibitor Icd-like protein [Citrobacter freundii]|uniref:host cell division inhibitor Icd-like protein n=2 Tax=Enterobacterales TaxID=91347 RepID=UPI00388F6071